MTEREAVLHQNIVMLLNNVGEPSKCKGAYGVPGCGATIYWVTHRNGAKTPYNAEGASHFTDCPMATEISRARKAAKDAANSRKFAGEG